MNPKELKIVFGFLYIFPALANAAFVLNGGFGSSSAGAKNSNKKRILGKESKARSRIQSKKLLEVETRDKKSVASKKTVPRPIEK